MKKRNLHTDVPEQFLLIDSILKLTGKSRATIYRWCRAGSFPSPYKISSSSIGWKQSDYNEWSKSLQKVRY